MNELRKEVAVSLGPMTQGNAFIVARCYCDFEGHGRASETWEEHWEVTLPQIAHHWMSTTGWRVGTRPELGMHFHGRTWEIVKRNALAFLGWYNKQLAPAVGPAGENE